MKRKLLALTLAVLMVICAAGCTGTNPTTSTMPSSQGGTTENTGDAPTTLPEPTEDITEPAPQVTEPTQAPDVTEPTVPTDVTGPTDVTVPGDVTEPTVPDGLTPTEPTQVTTPTEPSVTKPTEPQPTKPAPATPTKLTASVKGSYQVGDTLKTSAFTVKVTMSDGTVLTNPSGWSASPMKLSSTSNKITVSYKGLSTTVTVKATLGSIDGMDVVEESVKYLGLAYVSGGNSLTNGTDCSGFTKLIYAKFGIELPRTPSAQNKVGTKISAGEARPGDLLVETYPEEAYYDGHSGIYIGGGKMISEMPGSGLVIGSVHEGMDYLRIFDNSYSGTDREAHFEVMDLLISLGHMGSYEGLPVLNWDTGNAIFRGHAPNGSYQDETGYLRLNIHEPTEHYENLLAAWKSLYLAKRGYITMEFGSYENYTAYSYLNGKWVLTSELEQKKEAGEITAAVLYAAGRFYGAFWNSNAVITNGLGEEVDLSTCPGIQNYSSIAKPGDPNEGKANRLPLDPEAKSTCKYAHNWKSTDYDPEKKDYVKTCRMCGYQVTASYGVKDHKHTLMAEFWYGGIFEDSEVHYECMTCDYTKNYVITPGKGADHTHDYSYQVSVYEPTCIMDGFTLHECICTLSYRDNVKKAHGHSYENGECTDCGSHK